MARKIFRALGYLVILLIVVGIAAFIALDRNLPEGVEGDKAEALTDKVLSFVEAQGWDTTAAVTFTYGPGHTYLWDRTRNLARVSWGDTQVLIDLDNQKGKAWENGKLLAPDAWPDKVQTAWEYWCNDSFWLNPLTKLRDPGTTRKYVALEGPQDGLLVTYNSGGVTPGDSYLWYVNPDGQPTHWRMWVKILPIGGLQTSWENWKTLYSGAKVATTHKLGPISISVANLKAAASVEALANGDDPFAPLFNTL